MKKFINVPFAITIIYLSSFGLSHAKMKTIDDVEDVLINICSIIKADDTNRLRSMLKRIDNEVSMKLKQFYSVSDCGGYSLIRTAIINKSFGTGTLLVKNMSIIDLVSLEKDGKTVSNWASENNFSKSSIIDLIKQRL